VLGRITPKIVKLWIMRAERAAGLPETGRCHVFRHTFASHLAMAAVPTRSVKALARHTSIRVTGRYMHLSPAAADEGIAALVRVREERAIRGHEVDGRDETP
jgi:site-specific recombinase XerD